MMETILNIWELLPLVFALVLGATLIFCLGSWIKYEIDQYKYAKFNQKRTNDYGSNKN